jgi:hypothetical protein
MRRLAILTTSILLISASFAAAQGVARHPGEGDFQRYGGQWRYQHRYWNSAGHLNPKVCWQWDPIDGKYEWECE